MPDVLDVFVDAKTSDMLMVFLFGLCWGLGVVFFGQSIAMIGVSLSFALSMGLATALGTLIPMSYAKTNLQLKVLKSAFDF